MIDLIAEASQSLRFSCTILFVLPLAAAGFTASRRSATVAVGVAVAALVAWLRFSGWFPAPPTGASRVLVGLGAGLIFAVGLARITSRRLPLDLGGALGTSAVAAVVAAWFWIPCVGAEFAGLLNDMDDAPVAALPVLAVFVATLAAPVLLIAAAGDLFFARRRSPGTGIAGSGSVIGLALCGLIVFGVYEELARLGL